MIGGPTFVRVNPETPCQPNGAHHPHRWNCVDPDCAPEGYCEYAPLLCCVCSQEWPCDTRQERDAAKAAHRRKHRPEVRE